MLLSFVKRREAAVFFFAGVLLSIDKLNLPGVVSVSPAFAFASIAVLIFTFRFRPTSKITAVLFWFLAYTTVHGLLLAITDVLVDDYGSERLLSYGRQLLALAVGVAVFFFVRQLVIVGRSTTIGYYLLLGGIPALVLSMVQQIGGYSPGGILTPVTVFVRSHIIGMDPYMPRITGLSPEPAAYSGYLAALVIPLAVSLIFADTRRLRIAGAVGFVISVTLILMTFSGVGYLLLSITSVASVFATPRRWRMHAIGVLVIVFVAQYSFLAFTPGNYLLGVVRETETFAVANRALNDSPATQVPPTSTPGPTATDVPIATATDVPVATPTDVPIATATDVPVATATEVPVATATEVPIATATDVPVATATDVPIATATDVPIATPTDVPVATATDVPIATATQQPTTAEIERPDPVSPKWIRDIAKPLGIGDPLLVLTSIFGKKTGTFASKTYSTVDPVRNLGSPRGFLGYGLGGSPYHVEEFLSPEALANFPNTLGGGKATLKTLLGRVAAETGMIGLLLLVWLAGLILIQLRKIIEFDNQQAGLARVAFISLVTVLFGSVATFGSFASPFLWISVGIVAGLLAKSVCSETAKQS